MQLNIYKHSGMSLVELMVAMLISLFLTAGLFTMFNMSSSNVTTTSQFSELQENGRIALVLMEKDISQLGFMGDITGTDLIFNVNAAVSATAITNDCIGAGLNNSTFPLNVPAHFRRLWGYEKIASGPALSCGSSFTPQDNTDVIQIKRLVGPSVLAANRQATRYYAAVTSNAINFFDGNGAVPNMLNSRLWEYQHHVYFIKNDGSIPVLRRKTLTITNGMNNEDQLVEGIENIRILYGFDNNGDSSPDRFIPASAVSTFMWDNQGFQRLVALKLFVMVRTSQEDKSYYNKIIYKLGDKTIGPLNDHYRRKVMSTTVVLENPVLINS
jgi:type IV pilus assembly protein PilW